MTGHKHIVVQYFDFKQISKIFKFSIMADIAVKNDNFLLFFEEFGPSLRQKVINDTTKHFCSMHKFA